MQRTSQQLRQVDADSTNFRNADVAFLPRVAVTTAADQDAYTTTSSILRIFGMAVASLLRTATTPQKTEDYDVVEATIPQKTSRATLQIRRTFGTPM